MFRAATNYGIELRVAIERMASKLFPQNVQRLLAKLRISEYSSEEEYAH